MPRRPALRPWLLLLAMPVVAACGASEGRATNGGEGAEIVADAEARGEGTTGGTPTADGDAETPSQAGADADADADAGGATADAGDGTSEGAADVAAGACPDGEGAAGGVLWELPLCDEACDRVVDCGVDGCEGFDWTSAGALAADCWTACDADSAYGNQVLVASDCEAVAEATVARIADYEERCLSNPCTLGCETLGTCIVEGCPGFFPPFDAQIAADCASDCKAEDIAWILGMPDCEAIVGAIKGFDPGFANACDGVPKECASPADCGAWGEKLTACMVEHCEPGLSAFVAGLEQGLAGYCAGDPNCPSASEVANVLDAAVDCEHPLLADVGPAPPFTALCASDLGVSAAEVQAACEGLMACPGSEGFHNVDVCMVVLGMHEDVVQRVQCLLGAEACDEELGCLEGF